MINKLAGAMARRGILRGAIGLAAAAGVGVGGSGASWRDGNPD